MKLIAVSRDKQIERIKLVKQNWFVSQTETKPLLKALASKPIRTESKIAPHTIFVIRT